MILEPRPLSGSPQEIYMWKVARVLTWTFEFKFSSVSTLARILGLNARHSSEFFKKLIEDGYLTRWSSAHYNKKDLVRLGPEASSFFQGEIPESRTRLDRIDKVNLEHDFYVQDELSYLISEIEIEEIHAYLDRSGTEAPDAIIKVKGFKKPAYVEFENSKRSEASADIVCGKYHELIKEGKIDSAAFYFRQEWHKKNMERILRKRAWPVYEHVRVERSKDERKKDPREKYTLKPKKPVWIEDHDGNDVCLGTHEIVADPDVTSRIYLQMSVNRSKKPLSKTPIKKLKAPNVG